MIVRKGGKRTPERQLLLFVAPSYRRDSLGMLHEEQHLADRFAIEIVLLSKKLRRRLSNR
jgi:hypothetical protein